MIYIVNEEAAKDEASRKPQDIAKELENLILDYQDQKSKAYDEGNLDFFWDYMEDLTSLISELNKTALD